MVTLHFIPHSVLSEYLNVRPDSILKDIATALHVERVEYLRGWEAPDGRKLRVVKAVGSKFDTKAVEDLSNVFAQGQRMWITDMEPVIDHKLRYWVEVWEDADMDSDFALQATFASEGEAVDSAKNGNWANEVQVRDTAENKVIYPKKG